jgi:hypothetical protein
MPLPPRPRVVSPTHPRRLRHLPPPPKQGFWASAERPAALSPCRCPASRRCRPRTAPEREGRPLYQRPRQRAALQGASRGPGLPPSLSARGPRISSLSNSAIEAKIPNTSRPLGVEVSICPKNATLRAGCRVHPGRASPLDIGIVRVGMQPFDHSVAPQ